jgi:hypothetical protein
MFDVRVVIVAVTLVACGRLGFDARSTDGGARDASPLDSQVGALCGSDADCGPCQRCDAGACANETISQLYGGHRTTCFLGRGGSRWCVGEDPGLGSGVLPLFPQRIAGEDGWTTLALGYTTNLGMEGSDVAEWKTTDVPVGTPAPDSYAQISVQVDNPICERDTLGNAECGGVTAPGSWLWIDAGDVAQCGVKTDHTLWCWGTNLMNSLGPGQGSDGTVVAAPAQVGTENTWAKVSIGHGLACAQKLDSSVWCWGAFYNTGTNGVDTMGVPTQVVSSAVDYQVRWQHACARLASKLVVCWGTDEYGLEVVPGLTAVNVPMSQPGLWDAFVLGGHHYCGLASGVWSCWGWNAAGQLGIGTTTTHQTPTVPICTQGT